MHTGFFQLCTVRLHHNYYPLPDQDMLPTVHRDEFSKALAVHIQA